MRYLLALMLSLQVAGASAEPLNVTALKSALEQVLDAHPTARRTTVCLKVVDLETGKVLFDRGGDRLLTPASNLKIYTSACALDLFGPEHRFETVVSAGGPLGENGFLDGTIDLIGGGDSMLSATELRKLAKRVVEEWQLKEVKAQVFVDNNRYGSPLKGPGWMWDDDPDYYNMPVTPLMLDFNVLELELTEDAAGQITGSKILSADYPPIITAGAEELPPGRLFWRRPFDDVIVVAERGDLKGYLSSLKEDEAPQLTPLDPGQWIGAVFGEMLREEGVEVLGELHLPLDGTRPEDIRVEGLPLAETLRHFNHVSENAVGEVLLHEIAIKKGVDQPKWSDGATAISKWLIDEAGLEAGSFRLVDGSGLSRYNLISADSSVKLLAYMSKHENFETFFRALPGYEVEVEELKLPDGLEEGFSTQRVRAKPGGMSGVSTISGYLETLDGRQLAFSLLANGYTGSSRPVLELRKRVWRTLVQYRAE